MCIGDDEIRAKFMVRYKLIMRIDEMKNSLRKISGSGILTIIWLMFSLNTSYAASPLVDVDWVKTNAGVKGIMFIDLRGANAYRAGHVPGAVNSSYGRDKWRMKRDGIKGMLPPTAHLEKLIGRLGIDNSSHVVLMHGGYSAAETGIATRIYWTLKVLGHNEISILNGGMSAYVKDKSAPLEKGVVHPVAKTFTAKMNFAVAGAIWRCRESNCEQGSIARQPPDGSTHWCQ